MSDSTESDGLVADTKIEINLNRLSQLFNSLDPSPFHERDLDQDAEDYIVGSAEEAPRQHPLRLVIHLPAGQLPHTGAPGLQRPFTTISLIAKHMNPAPPSLISRWSNRPRHRAGIPAFVHVVARASVLLRERNNFPYHRRGYADYWMGRHSCAFVKPCILVNYSIIVRSLCRAWSSAEGIATPEIGSTQTR
jgi:hypothetical protein